MSWNPKKRRNKGGFLQKMTEFKASKAKRTRIRLLFWKIKVPGLFLITYLGCFGGLKALIYLNNGIPYEVRTFLPINFGITEYTIITLFITIFVMTIFNLWEKE